MLENKDAIRLTGEKRINEIADRLVDYDLFNLCREAMSYDGSFDFCDVFDLEDLCGIVNDKYELVCSIVYGDIKNVDDWVRYNAYGNLESVTEHELYTECQDCIGEIAEWLMDNYSNVDCLYEEEKELFDAWWEIDHDQYDWEEE